MDVNDIAALLEQEIASQRLAERKSIDGIATNDLVALLAGWESLQLARGSGLPAPPRTAPHNSGRRSARPLSHKHNNEPTTQNSPAPMAS